MRTREQSNERLSRGNVVEVKIYELGYYEEKLLYFGINVICDM